jgi:MoaE-MoaD fusion protein
MRVAVKLFGSIREAVGEKELSVELPDGASARDLRRRLADRFTVFDRFGDRLAVSVQLEVVPLDTTLRDGDEVAFLPPVSGGAGDCWISDRPLQEADAVARVKGPGMGGIVTFVGAVRDHARGRKVQHLEYQAYPAMAVREMEKIAEQAAQRWPGTRIAIGHRSGHLEVGEVAVVIAAAAPHRAAAFDACRFAIDTLKQTVPIWKKEVATDGEYWVDDRP